MADLLIKGLALPKGRDQLCLYVQRDGTVNVEIDTFEGDIQTLKDTTAIELPQHGRLISESNALEEIMCVTFEEPIDHERVIEAIKDTPTIVEASNGSDN